MDALALSAGIALTITIIVELGVRTMLLIPNAIHTILEKGRREGEEKGRELGRDEVLDRLVNEAVITEEQRKHFESNGHK